jgi:putative transposase
MPRRIKAHRIRIYPDATQQALLRRTFGCCRLVYNLALEQRSVFWRPGRRISFVSWSAELKALKDTAPFLRDVPHHCLLQALKDLDSAYARFFSGDAAYPRPRRKFGNEACRFPDPSQFRLERDGIVLPKLGALRARIHRPVQGRLKSITVSREGGHWYASVLVSVRAAPPAARPVAEGGYDVGIAQPVVDSDGAVYRLPRRPEGEERRCKRLQQRISRCAKGSRRREKAREALRRLEARAMRRRRDAAHKVSHRLTAKYTHLAAENLNLANMTASARGSADAPGVNVAQKAGLNRAILDIAPGQLRRLCAYKAEWRGGMFACVDPQYTSQTCSECGRHPRDDPATAQIAHGRITRDGFICPFCGFAADADFNAARVIRARGRPVWTAQKPTPRRTPRPTTAAGPAVPARGALSTKEGDAAGATAPRREAGKKISTPGGLPQAA